MRKLFILVAFLCCLQQVRNLLTPIPGLNINKITFGSFAGPTYGASASGHTFTTAWASPLLSISAYGLGLYNFETAPHGMLSYTTKINSLNSTAASISIFPDIPDSKIRYLAFTFIVIDKNNSYVELLTFQRSVLSSSLYVLNSSKFVFGGINSPSTVQFFEWVTATDISGKTYDNYWAYIYISPVNGTSSINVTKWRDTTFMVGAKMHVLLVGSTVGNSRSLVYQTQVRTGSYVSQTFSYNFGVNASQFGEPASGNMCLLGLSAIDLYFYRSTSNPASTSFTFTFSGSQVSNIPFSYVYEVRMQVLCAGFDSKCSYSYFDSVTGQCQPCKFDCWTCLSPLTCLTCNPAAYRELNSTSQSCQPIQGYYQSGSAVSSKCPTGCSGCLNSSYCSSCASGYQFQINNNNKLCTVSTASSTNSQNNSENNSSVSITSIVTATIGSVAFICFLVCCCRAIRMRRLREQQQRQDQYFRGSMPSQNRLEEIDGTQQSVNQVWVEKDSVNLIHEECSICLSNEVNIHTKCGHYFHLKCIISWSRKVDSCPNCRHTLKNSIHKLICAKCSNRQVEYDFKSLKKINRSNSIDRVATCGQCLKSSISIE